MNAPRHTKPPVLTPPANDPELYGRNVVFTPPAGMDHAHAMIEIMRAIVHDSDRHKYVPTLARRLFDRVKIYCKSPAAEAISQRLKLANCTAGRLLGLFNTMRSVQKFTRDPKTADMPRHVDQLAWEVLTTKKTACDCDCIAMLAAAIARAWGYETAFVLVGESPRDRLRHVFYAVKLRGEWYPFDPQVDPSDTHKPSEPFVWPTRAVRREIFPVDA